MRASIVIPLKSQQNSWLEQCVRSATRQTVRCEVIVVCSAKTPVSNREVLQRIAKDSACLRILMEEKPGSFPAAINQGIRAAGSDRVGFLLSDDWLDSDAVEQCLAHDADIVATGHTTFYADGITVLERASDTPSLKKYQALPSVEARAEYLEHFFLFRKQALLNAGGLDETIGNFPGIDDYDLIWTLLERGASVALVERRLYNYRDHEGERLTLADAAEAARNLEKILRKHGVPESAIPGKVRATSQWFGKPIYKVITAS